MVRRMDGGRDFNIDSHLNRFASCDSGAEEMLKELRSCCRGSHADDILCLHKRRLIADALK